MAHSNIAESLLEMHYLRVLARRYRRILGRDIQIFKPATSAEHWYGFDQAYFTADVPKPVVIRDPRKYVQSSTTPTFTVFGAFLLQFKVVEIASKRSRLSPPGWDAPYYRSELYLEPNRTTGISQHEALRRLSGLAGTSVAYVCPMIFEENDALKRPRFCDLRFVNVTSSPGGWLTNERHFIAFQTPTSPPTWCSGAVAGEALAFKRIVQQATPVHAQRLFDLLARFRAILMHKDKGETQQDFLEAAEANFLPPSLSIVAELSREKRPQD